jgi:restriction system protein
MDATKLSLDEWLTVVLNENDFSYDFIFYQFPTQPHFEEYIVRIREHSESDVKTLLRRFLIPCGSLMIDSMRYESFDHISKADPAMYERMMHHSYFQRLQAYSTGESEPPPWEGITWVLDLLPHWPKDALKALDAYFLAHAQVLPDGRFQGMSDAMAVIRAWYIGSPGSHAERLESLKQLSPREFEYLIYSLYRHMKYSCSLTPAQKDGGRDVVATRAILGAADTLRVECKRWNSRVGVAQARALLGVVSSEKANKGVLVTSGSFTKVARAFSVANPRLELIDGHELITMLNEHLGTSWPTRLDSIISESRREAAIDAA